MVGSFLFDTDRPRNQFLLPATLPPHPRAPSPHNASQEQQVTTHVGVLPKLGEW